MATEKGTASLKPAKGPVALLIGTRKGAFILRGDRARRTWKLSHPQFLGQIVHHVVLDPRDRRTMLMAARTGHLGPTVFRSTDQGKTWKEAKTPPAFPKAPDGQTGRVVDHVFWLTPGHASEPNAWYAGTSPQGLFRSDDGGVTWKPFSYINDDPQYREWMGTVQDGTPDGPKLHSIIVDPRDPRHLYFGMSGGGVHESVDGGKTFTTLLEGLDVVEGFDRSTPTVHDPHCVRLCPGNPDRLYQQNHCGIYRIDRPSKQWLRIGNNMPKRIGDVGFPMVVHPRDPETAWVFPMDGTGVWPRVSPGGKPAVYRTRNAGQTWARLNKNFPKSQAWWTVKRQAMTADAHEPVGLYFGTTSGEVWASRTGGANWTCLARHLPEIYSVEAAEL
ncbi:MAG: glycosyl hydrolase [Nitrospirae bacterium RIFCSPLOWO2_02_FULL_62_14]|nr:MAG: glycosyl hydrolase [Nitrospirae bacterium RIFCSPLOWO2_02_FULL_62_14]OGW70103.1 MAG: glycosyl hydrolase [Nitrospirae bacterium RIFCSPLOWO2_01_FULL_62_17]